MPGWGRWDRWARSGQWGDGGGVELTWLLRDLFTTADAAPITSPRTCEPGPGTVTIVDTGNNADIVGGEFKATGNVGVGDPGFKHDRGTSTEHVGLAVFGKIRTAADSDRWRFGFDGSDSTAPNNGAVLKVGTTLVSFTEQGQATGYMDIGLIENTASSFLIVRRSGGNFFIVDGKLWWVGNAETLANNWAIFAPYNAASDTRCDDFSLIDLPDEGYTEWDEDFSTVTDSKTNPATSSLFNADADCHLTFTFTFEATKTVYVGVRYDISAGSLTAQCRGDGTLYLKDGSVTRFNGAVFSDGVEYTIDLVANGLVASIYVDNVLIWSGAVSHLPTRAAGSVSINQLVTNDLVLSTHPYPSLGIATDRLVTLQDDDTATHADDALVYFRNVTVPVLSTRRVYFRFIDSENALAVDFKTNGELDFNERRTAGVQTLINTGIGTVSDGDDVCFVFDGTDAELFVNGISVGSTTGIDTILTGTAFDASLAADDLLIDSVEFFPRDVASILPSELV